MWDEFSSSIDHLPVSQEIQERYDALNYRWAFQRSGPYETNLLQLFYPCSRPSAHREELNCLCNSRTDQLPRAASIS